MSYAATYGMYIDWQNTGGWGDPGDDVTARLRDNPPKRLERGRDQVRAMAPPMAGKLGFELDNQSRDYSIANGASPLAGCLVPGRQVKFTATYNGNSYPLFRGFLDDLPQYPGWNKRSVGCPTLGTLSWLRGKKISTSLYQNIRTDQALQVILNTVGWPMNSSIAASSWDTGLWGTAVWAAGGWPAFECVLDVGQTVLEWWWLDNEDAFDAAVTLLNSEGPGAAIYEDGQGRIIFESRNYRYLNSRCTTSQATFRDSGAEPLFATGFVYQPRLKDIVNFCTFQVVKRQVEALQSVWDNGDEIILAANETRDLKASGNAPFQNAITPAEGVDFSVTAGSISAITIDRTSGASVTITITAGGNGATLSWLQLRAQPVTVLTQVDVQQTLDVSSSQRTYGIQGYQGRIRQEISVNVAQDLANAIVRLYQNPRALAQVPIWNRSDECLTQQLTREVSDRITVIETQTGVSSDFWIERIQHEISEVGYAHKTVFGCEIVSGVDWGIWDAAGSTWGTAVWGY